MEIVNGGESTEVEYVRRKLIEYNSVQTPHEVPQTYEEFNILLKDHSGTVLGGILAVVMWNVMVVEVIWVDECVRGNGYGSQLLNVVEKNAQERGCVCVQLDTFSFQAPDFYKKHGYELFGTLEYLPNKFARYYLVKWINGNKSS